MIVGEEIHGENSLKFEYYFFVVVVKEVDYFFERKDPFVLVEVVVLIYLFQYLVELIYEVVGLLIFFLGEVGLFLFEVVLFVVVIVQVICYVPFHSSLCHDQISFFLVKILCVVA